MSKDINGGDYVKVAEVHLNDRVELDKGFTCHSAGEVTIHIDEGGLFFDCNEGKHYLSGQVRDDHYVGIYKL